MLNDFYKLPSVVQILVAEFMVTICLGGLAPYAYRVMFPRKLSYAPFPLDWGDAAFGALGIALLAWLMWGPLFPRIAGVSWTPVFRAGGAVTTMPSAAVDYGFATNHPSYVFIDAIVVGFWWFFRVIMGEGDPERVYEANLWVAVASIVPIWRLICWYILRRRPVPPDHPDIRNAWYPVAMLHGFVLPVVALIGIMVLFGS